MILVFIDLPTAEAIRLFCEEFLLLLVVLGSYVGHFRGNRHDRALVPVTGVVGWGLVGIFEVCVRYRSK